MKRLNLYNIPDDLYEWVSALAAQEHRSVSAQVIFLLRQRMRKEQEKANV